MAARRGIVECANIPVFVFEITLTDKEGILEFIGVILFAGACYWVCNAVYHQGKSTGSRKGYNVGRSRGARSRRR